MKTVFIVNPVSGRKGRGPERYRAVQAFARRRCPSASVWDTEYVGHATRLAERALEEGYEKIVCVGGDGTINEVARSLVGGETVFGLVPMGSGNGLARHLGLPLRFEEALECAAQDHQSLIDTGEANGVAFFNVMGIGFDAEVGRRFNEQKGRGFQTYLNEGWKAFRSYRAHDYELQVNGRSYPLHAYMIALANSSQYGNDAYVAAGASVRDGKLDLVAIQTPGFFGMALLCLRMFQGKLEGSSKVKAFRAERFRLRTGRPGFFHADGEIVECGSELDIVCRPLSLRVAAADLKGR